MVETYAYRRPTARALFIAQECCAIVPSGAVKLTQTGVAMAGTTGNVWPKSPRDGTTG